MINLNQQRKYWLLSIQFPDVEIPLSRVKLDRRPTLELQEEQIEDGVWRAKMDLAKWHPIRVTFLTPTHRDLIGSLFTLWESRVAKSGWRTDPELKGEAILRMMDGFGNCFETWSLGNAWVSDLDETEFQTATQICLEVSYDSVKYHQPIENPKK